MEDRRSSNNRSQPGRRQFNKQRGPGQGGQPRGNSAGGKKRFFKKRSAASEAKMPPPRPGSRPKTNKPWENVKRVKITSDYQVTDGRHQGVLLQNVDKINAAVSPRKLRESMFRMLARKIRAGRFLDLCAGNGTVGVEALSRGAMLGTFVERSARMTSCIKKNLELCGIKDGHSEIIQMEVLPFLRRVGRRRRFWDIVYCGTPCDNDFDVLLKCFGNGYSLRPGGMLILEHPAGQSFPDNVGLLHRRRLIDGEGSSLTIYERI
jgi:16S rRNA (guanine(966)-N(2))-methyltransferase RsmD